MKNWSIKKHLLFLSVVVFTMLGLQSCGYERIDAGHAGIRVNLYGDEKGVDNVTEVTGAVWYNPFKTQIFEFPTFVQTKDYSVVLQTFNGLKVEIDCGINYFVDPNMVTDVFIQYRKDIGYLEDNIINKRVRQAWSEAIDTFTAEHVYQNKEKLRAAAFTILQEDLAKRGFILESLVYNSAPVLPPSVVANIEAKVNATQIALQKRSEIEQVIADSIKAVTQANTDAEVVMIEARAQADANKLVASSITKQLIEYEIATRWNGVQPSTLVTGSDNCGILIGTK